MFKKITIAALAVGALALNAPAALADDPVYDCNFNSVQQADATGQNYEGAAWGWAVHPGGGNVTVRCYITVNGGEVASTTPGSGSGAAATGGRVTFAAGDTDNVQLWAEVTTDHGTITHPYETTHTQLPPQAVLDLLDSIFDTIADVTKPADVVICTALKAAGAPALINSLTAVTGISMDADDCDLWDETTSPRSYIIDFDPYGS